MKQWFTLHTKPKAEYQVETALRQRGMQTYLPEIEAPRSRQGALRTPKPFFPCYLFTRIDFEAVGISQVRWTPGLRRIVAFDERPVPLGDDIIELIRRKVDSLNARGQWPLRRFQPGDTVRITNGTLQGLLAIFEGPTTPAERVQVLLSFLGQVSRAKIPVAYLEKAPPGAEAPKPHPPRRTRGRGRRLKPKTT